MFFRTLFAMAIVASVAQSSSAQTIEVLTSGTKTSLRGLSAVSDNIIWVSGSGGHVGRTIDGGKTWQWNIVPGFEKREFRDIEAADANTAIVVAIAEPGQILRTTDGGKNWKVVFTDTARGMFLDAMDFADETNGVVIGDPLPGTNTIYRAYTRNGGLNWFHPADDKNHISPVKEGEAMFASSGTNVLFLKSDGFLRNNKMLIVTGGTASNLLSQNPLAKKSLPIIQGRESTGANSIASFNGKELVIVGGDFSNDKDTTQNCILSKDGGLSFVTPNTAPHGYRSCVEYITRNRLVTCGTSGIDVSEDGGNNWRLISNESYHVCQKAKKGRFVFLAGGNGRIAKLAW
jgi:hypothetical protein